MLPQSERSRNCVWKMRLLEESKDLAEKCLLFLGKYTWDRGSGLNFAAGFVFPFSHVRTGFLLIDPQEHKRTAIQLDITFFRTDHRPRFAVFRRGQLEI